MKATDWWPKARKQNKYILVRERLTFFIMSNPGYTSTIFKSINAHVLMPGGDKTGSQACVTCLTFDPVKPKVVFRVFKSMEGETSIEFCSIKTVVLFN